MNPLVRNYLRQITQATEELGEILAEQRETLAAHRDAKEKLQRDVWSRQKEIAVLQEAAADYASLKEENAQHRAREAELGERLRKVLAYTKALTEEVRR